LSDRLIDSLIYFYLFIHLFICTYLYLFILSVICLSIHSFPICLINCWFCAAFLSWWHVDWLVDLLTCWLIAWFIDADVCAADAELVLKFSAGLAVSVNLLATVDNVQHVDRLRVQVSLVLFYHSFYLPVPCNVGISAVRCQPVERAFIRHHGTVRYDRWFALENWQASCQFNLTHKLKKLKIF